MYFKILKLVERLLLILVFFAISLILYFAIIYPVYLESLAELGMAKNEVLENFKGKNYQLSETLRLCDQGAWYGDCEKAGKSNSVNFLILKTGIDSWLVVGFNKVGEVSFVGRGDT